MNAMKLLMFRNLWQQPVVWLQWCVYLLIGLLVSSCATISPNFEQPDVKVLSIERLPPEGMDPRFAVHLKVTNPNDTTLYIKGMSYSLSIESYEVASGVTAKVPALEPYSEANFTVPMSTSLINSIRLLKHLIELNKSSLNYRLEAKLDLGIPMMPKLSVVEEGDVQLGNLQ